MNLSHTYKELKNSYMTQYIDKAAVVAEIERRKHKLLDNIMFERDKEWVVRTAHQLNRIILFLDTLEVKEVDLEKETEHVKGDYEQADVAWNKDNNMKYIDADKLKAEIESIGLIPQISADYNDGRNDMKIMFLDTIDSLQQEQPETSKGKFMFPKFLYARTKDNKTIDVSYVPQSLDAMEYIRSDSLQQEQPEVDLEKEVTNWWNDHYKKINNDYEFGKYNGHYMANSTIISLAKHFFELGIKAQKGNEL